MIVTEPYISLFSTSIGNIKVVNDIHYYRSLKYTSQIKINSNLTLLP